MKMKLVKIIFVVMLMLFTASLFAQDKVSVNYKNQEVRSAIEQLCKGNNKDYTIERSVVGYVTLNLTDKPFETVLSAICEQVGATYKYEDGIYKITSLRGGGMGTPGMPGMGMGTPGMPGMGMGTPGMPGMGMGTPGMPGMGMGTPGMPGMGGGVNPSINVSQATVRNVEKIQLMYNHPAELLQMLSGSLYVDVAFSGGGGSGTNSGSNSNNNNNNNNNNSSRGSGSSSGSSSRNR